MEEVTQPACCCVGIWREGWHVWIQRTSSLNAETLWCPRTLACGAYFAEGGTETGASVSLCRKALEGGEGSGISVRCWCWRPSKSVGCTVARAVAAVGSRDTSRGPAALVVNRQQQWPRRGPPASGGAACQAIGVWICGLGGPCESFVLESVRIGWSIF